jgi:hypothetical protein
MIANTRAAWTFTERVLPARRECLLAYHQFDEVVALLRSARIEPLYRERATAPHLTGCHRASFKLNVHQSAYDAFFNAPAGYRGQYALGEAQGTRANRAVLAALMPRMLTAFPTSAMSLAVSTSLHGKQAKIWINEPEVQDQLGDPCASIDWPEWQFNEPDGQGLRAPLGSILEVKGAWIDSTGHEVINPYKCGRARNIYRTGDSK